jgi:hypothetical protein
VSCLIDQVGDLGFSLSPFLSPPLLLFGDLDENALCVEVLGIEGERRISSLAGGSQVTSAQQLARTSDPGLDLLLDTLAFKLALSSFCRCLLCFSLGLECRAPLAD